MSIRVACAYSLLLAAAVVLAAAARHPHSNHGEGGPGGGDHRPPINMGEAHRICASLCFAGLGGRPCGKQCDGIGPANFTASPADDVSDASSSASGGGVSQTGGVAFAKTRRDACPLLCQYQLGEPLCDCPDVFPVDGGVEPYRVDFDRICAYFCVVHDYHLLGCRACGRYRRPPYLTMAELDRRVRPTDMGIDWEAWCRYMCAQGNGGAACNCDLLPFVQQFDRLQQPTEMSPAPTVVD